MKNNPIPLYPTLSLLSKMMATPSPSGFEGKLITVIYNYLTNFITRFSTLTIDEQNNLIVTLPGRDSCEKFPSSTHIVLDAHTDQIGFVVTNIQQNGKINIQYIGGGCKYILSAKELVILTENGEVPAIVNCKHAHLTDEEEDVIIKKIQDVELDIGTVSKRETLKYVKIGDPIIFKNNYTRLKNNCYYGHAFDDKIGCFLLLEVLNYFLENQIIPKHTITFLFSSQEEIGLTRAKSVVRNLNPSLFIAVDVTFATDYGEAEAMEREVGKCELGKGLVFYRGVDIDNKFVDSTLRLAKKENIPVQIQASTGMIGYNSTSVGRENNGIPTAVIGIPLRNMHSPCEVINMDDIVSGVKLLTRLWS